MLDVEAVGIHLDLTGEQVSFRDTTRKFIGSEVPLTTVRELYETPHGFDRDWRRAAAAIGWTSLFVPEAHGGGSLSGAPGTEAAIVAEEMGRLVSPGPFSPVNVVAAAIASAGDEAQAAAVLPGLAAGDGIATWALAEGGDRWSPETFTTTARVAGDTVTVDGEKAYVEAAGVADHVLVTARGDGGLTQVLVPTAAEGVADMAVWLEGMKAVTAELAASVGAPDSGAPLLAGAAKAYVGQHCVDLVDDCVQITGGLGVTWEHDLHLYNRRAVVDRAMYGSPALHRRRIARSLQQGAAG